MVDVTTKDGATKRHQLERTVRLRHDIMSLIFCKLNYCIYPGGKVSPFCSQTDRVASGESTPMTAAVSLPSILKIIPVIGVYPA